MIYSAIYNYREWLVFVAKFKASGVLFADLVNFEYINIEGGS